MDFLKNQLARLQQQFNQLTASQKMLSVSLVTIMVMTLLWWARYAGTSEMEPVVDQDLAPEEVARLTSDLRSRGIPVSSSGGRVLVATDRKNEALGVLLYSDSLSHDTSSTLLLDIMSKSTNAFSSSEQTNISYNAAREAMLGAIIKGFPGVRHAAVMLSAPQRTSFSEEPTSSATVQIQSRNPGEVDKRLAVAAAEVVMGAQPTLKRSAIHVIIDGVSHNLPSSDGPDGLMPGDDMLDLIAKAEMYYTNVAQQALSKIDGVMVHVSVARDDKLSTTESLAYDPKTSVIGKETENQNDNTTSTTGGGGAAEPGVVANTGLSVDASDSHGGGGMTKTEKSDVKSDNYVGQTKTSTRQVAINTHPVGASVLMPRSFFIKSYKAETQSDKDPTVALLEPYIKSKSDQYKAYVVKCLNLASEDAVAIQAYADSVPAPTDMPTQAGGAVSMMLTGHAKEIALGALALVSLFMVSMMVRKSGATLAVAGGGMALADGAGGAGSTVDSLLAKAGGKAAAAVSEAEVGEGRQSLDGVELDDEQVKAQQVVDQVSTLVKDNPDAAANLIKRWMNRS